METIILNDRSIIEISGEERKKFLQGLITNNVEKVNSTNLLYSVMLSPQGKFLYDFFIFESNETLFLDCFSARRDEIIKKLNFYKLRSKVVILKNDELKVAQNLEGDESKVNFIFNDPRHKSLGKRIYFKNLTSDFSAERLNYDFVRISNKIAESELDLTFDKSFILEFNFDNLNAIDYEKGCYVGQELTARTHYRGEIRKKLCHITIENLAEVEKNQEISCEGKSVGIVLSSLFYQNKLHALALIRLENFAENIDKLELEKNKVSIVL
ncbi:MAG: folate-binding protein YgfZ [Pelagibacterales bacterium]|nr:folate-binding protein YgfZ [Pelagibacterales bacterium]